MIQNINEETDTALTVVANDSIKELLKSGRAEEIQKIVQEGISSLPSSCSSFAWSKGQVVGKYEILRKIGKGGMGVIYLARHSQLGTLRALKVLPGESAEENPVFAERFIREARIASQIIHPNVVEVMDVETDAQLNVSYIVMEYVDGGSLRQVLKGQEKLNIEQSVVTVQAVASALNAAAEHGIVHRDIKPDNIMFTSRGGVKLADLGIAKKDDEEDNLTKTNVMMGTPAYLSPEQVENPKSVDIRSDIYSLGVTFYEMLTGQTPYSGKTSYDILRKIFTEPVPDPRSIKPDIPGEIASIVMKMIAKEPQKRYQTPEQVLDALAKIIPELSEINIQLIVKSIIDKNGDGAPEYTGENSVFTGTICRMRRKDKRKKVFKWAIGLSCLLAICAAVFFLLRIPAGKKSGWAGTKKSEIGGIIKTASYTLDIRTTPYASLRLIKEDGQVLTFAGNPDGIFNISGLTAGEYEVEISCPDYFSYKKKHRVPAASSLKLLLKPDVKTLDVYVHSGTKLELQYPDGQSKQFFVSSSGRILVENLKKGNYLLKAVHDKYLPAEKRILLENNSKITLQMEKIFKTFSLSTLPGSRVELLQNSQVKFSQKTAETGKNVFPEVRSGVYELKISAPHYKTHTSILHIEKDTSLAIPLEKLLYTLTVYGASGTRGVIRAGIRPLRSFEIPASGYVVASKMEPGKYQIDFSRKGFVSKKYEVNIVENASLQITLEAITVPVKINEVKKVCGKLNVYLSASEKLLDFVSKKGLEIKLDNKPWTAVKALPFTSEVEAGNVSISIRGYGIVPQMNHSVKIHPGKTAEVLLEIKAKSSKVVFASNRSDAVFLFGDRTLRMNEELAIEPFQEYSVSSKFKEQTVVKKVYSAVPGEKLIIFFPFGSKIHPLQRRYEEGMQLFAEENFKEALPILLEAAEASHPEAILQVADIYEKGLGMWFSNKKNAMHWRWKAAELKDVSSAVKVADAIYDKDIEASAAQMLDFYLLAVKAENPEITYKVSQLYKDGFRDIKQDDAQALKYLQKAAELGHLDAMYDLGVRYEKGIGVPFNSKTSLFWIKKAADKGHEKAEKYWNQINK